MANVDVQRTSELASQQGTGLARRGSFYPSAFSLSPRSLFTASPFELMRRFTEDMDRMFSDWGLSTPSRWGGESGWSPPIEVLERDNNLIVRAELPGCNKEDIKVELTDEGLLIQGERKQEHEEKQEGYYRSERSYGNFYRLIPLPSEVKEDQINAKFNNGILEVTVLIPESARNRREIPIEITAGEQSKAATGGKTKN
ncbi:MAG TPA: Hsp20/alpha crystallin family protein [Blastocatellia bacterium]|nr:Hsp20/alpha crystallin family protein [Blastocatellia bacterium]